MWPHPTRDQQAAGKDKKAAASRAGANGAPGFPACRRPVKMPA